MKSLYQDKRGQPVMVGIMIFMAVIIVIVAMIPLVKDVLGTARDADHLDCNNSSIDQFQAATCIVVDFTFLYFIGSAVGVATAYMWWRRGQV